MTLEHPIPSVTVQIKPAIAFVWSTVKNNLLLCWVVGILWALPGIILVTLPAWVCCLVAPFYSAIIMGGIWTIAFEFCDGQTPRISSFFSKTYLFWRYLTTGILVGFTILGGLVFYAIVFWRYLKTAGFAMLGIFSLFMIPGIYWGIQFMFALPAIMEHDLGPIAAMKASSQLTKGHKWELALFCLAFWAIMAVIKFAITVPIGVLLWPYYHPANIPATNVLALLNRPTFMMFHNLADYFALLVLSPIFSVAMTLAIAHAYRQLSPAANHEQAVS